METPPAIQEIEPGRGISGLEPGMYAAGCMNRFSGREYIGSACSPETARCLFAGTLLPYYLHNLNNLMVGVMGNLDLAGMFMPDISRVEPKMNAARAATGSVVDFIRDISGSFSDSTRSDLLQRVLTRIRAACGRSVSFLDLDPRGENWLDTGSPELLEEVLTGMGTWCVLCLGGSGTIRGETAEGTFSLEWKKPSSGSSHMPGREQAAEVLRITGSLCLSGGFVLAVEDWTDAGGRITLGSQ